MLKFSPEIVFLIVYLSPRTGQALTNKEISNLMWRLEKKQIVDISVSGGLPYLSLDNENFTYFYMMKFTFLKHVR